MKYSVVIPAYNEAERLPRSLPGTIEFFRSLKEPFEILVVDDGSRDATAEYVNTLSDSNSELKLLSYGCNKGKGYAVRTGALAAEGEIVLFCDADGSTPISEFNKLRDAIVAGADVAIGSRALASTETKVKTTIFRKIPGRIFNALANVLCVPGIADTQCGFKAFNRKAAEYCFKRQRAERFSFDVELLFLASRGGFKIAELPVNWVNVEGSKVNMLTDSIHMALDMLKFRVHALRGLYR